MWILPLFSSKMSIKMYSSTSREYHLFHRQLCKHRTFLSLNCFNRCNGKTWYPILFIFIAPISSDLDNFLTYSLLLYLHCDFCEFINGIFFLLCIHFLLLLAIYSWKISGEDHWLLSSLKANQFHRSLQDPLLFSCFSGPSFYCRDMCGFHVSS